MAGCHRGSRFIEASEKALPERPGASAVPCPGGAYPGRTGAEVALLPKLHIKSFPQNQEIYEEFISSEVSFGRFISHCIENRNVDIMDKDAFIEEKKKELSSMPSFDIFSLDSYEKIIQGLISADSYLEQFGDVNQLEWDMESLKNFLCILLKDHRSELIAYDSSQSSFDIASSFIYNAMCYAVVNQKHSIGPFEMLHTLRNWEKIPFQLRSDVATDVIEKMNLERDSHPFYQNPVKKKAEIISFSKLKKLDNK